MSTSFDRNCRLAFGSARRGAYRFMLLVTVVLAVFLPVRALAESRTVRVGLYENEPKAFTTPEGEPAGIFVDMLDEIAKDEDWQLEWVPGTWDANLAALEAGTLDLMPDVAYSAERDLVFDFHETPVIDSWSCVYAGPRARVDRISQLDGKRVAVLSGSIQESVFTQMAAGFEYDIEIIPYDSLAEAFAAASDGSVDAATANYLFGDYFYEQYGLTKTSIVFNAVPLHYATADGANPELLSAIDRHLDEWIDQPGSPYYQVLSRYTTREPTDTLPPWVLWTATASAALLVAALGLILLLRWQVRVKTRHLEEARTAVARAEEDLRLALDAAEQGIFDWNPQTGDLVWSPRNYTMLGYEPDEFPSSFRAWETLIHPADRQRVVHEEFESMRSGRQSFSVEYRLRTKSGGWLWTASRGKAVANDCDGMPTRIMGVNADITERKLAQLELEQHRNHLEELVDARTEELATANEELDASNEALRDANDELERALIELTRANAELETATAAKSRFFATMSHELRTPLNSIIGFASVLDSGMSGPLADEQATQVRMIRKSGERLLGLINNILDLSKIEAGAVELHLTDFDPAEVVEDVALSLTPLADEKRIELRTELPPEAHHVLHTDKDRLHQILLNIAGNAVKFTDTGHVTIRVHPDTDDHVDFDVEDTGPGIPADEIHHIFQAFAQAHVPETMPAGGTGLGLAISQDFAQMLGGELTVESVQGEGSVFTLHLPR